MNSELEYRITRIMEGEDPEDALEEPSLLMVSYKKDVVNLYKTLKDQGLKPIYRYSNTSARTPFYFNTEDPLGALKRAYKLATELGIKCELI